METYLPFCFFIQFLEQLLKFLSNFTLLKYVKSQRSYGFLITKKLIFGFQILDLKVHFSASLGNSAIAVAGESELEVTNIIVHRTACVLKTNQDIPLNLQNVYETEHYQQYFFTLNNTNFYLVSNNEFINTLLILQNDIISKTAWTTCTDLDFAPTSAKYD